MRFLATAPDRVRLEEISSATSMTMEDVCNTLIQQNMIFIREPTPPSVRPSPGQSIRHFKGRRGNPPRKQMQRMQSHQLQYLDNKANGSEGKGPFVPPQHYEIRFDRAKVNTFLDKWESKGYLKLKPDKLQWTPYKVTRKEEILPTVPLVNFNRTNNANVDVEEQKHAGGIMEDGSGGDTTASVNGRTTVEPVTPARRSGDDDDNDDAMNVDGSNRDDEQDILPDLTTPRTTRRQASLRSPAKSKGSAKQGRTETPSISLRSRRGVGSTPVQKQEEEEGAVVEECTPPPDPPKKRKGRPPLPPSEKERRRLERQQKNLASISPAINGARKPRTRGNIINSSPIIEVEESISTRSTRRGRRPMKTVAISDAESSSDQEEGESAVVEALGERQLRSRRSDEGSAVPTPPRPSLVRNRSRVVTSPLEEEEEEEEVEEPTQPKLDNDVEDEDAEGDEDVPAYELPDVHAVNGDVESTDMVVDSPEVNGIDQAEETDRQSTKTPETTEQVGIDVYKEDIKAEDVVFAVNGDGMSSKYVGFVSSQAEVHGPQHAESDLRSTLESELDDCHDEDADGEDDVDASGEEETEIMAF
ncbi:hypothetical protein BJ165DRAFT_1029150 [Panaeolus papilionaceus]|nr:hypothetical protein BJ165DRAFT_1029150 [Panaeolus papilionaceus]